MIFLSKQIIRLCQCRSFLLGLCMHKSNDLCICSILVQAECSGHYKRRFWSDHYLFDPPSTICSLLVDLNWLRVMTPATSEGLLEMFEGDPKFYFGMES